MVGEQLAGQRRRRRARLLAGHFARVGERQAPALLKSPVELCLLLVGKRAAASATLAVILASSKAVRSPAVSDLSRKPAADGLHADPGLRRYLPDRGFDLAAAGLEDRLDRSELAGR